MIRRTILVRELVQAKRCSFAEGRLKDRNPSANGWHLKRIGALVLTLGLAVLAVRAWSEGVGDAQLLFLMCVGVTLGCLYVVRGGSLPAFLYRKSKSRLGGTGITADDDPRNISPKVYLPILMIALAVATALYFYYGRRR